MSAIDFEPLWEKSRAMVRLALTARNDGDFGSFCLWCAVSLELLGKAVLASIHPALVVDPQDVDSLFVACGRSLTADPRTIIAKTVFSRLQKLSTRFGQPEADACMRLMQRRNAHLHSGDLPYANLNPDSWAPRFWELSQVILGIGGKTLDDWVGTAEAQNALALIGAAATVREQSVRARADVARASFEASHPSDDEKVRIRQLARGGRLVEAADFGHFAADTLVQESCPVCLSDGRLSAQQLHEDEPDANSVDWESGVMTVNVHFAPIAFRCAVCGLRLDGHEELALLGIGDEFDLEEQREVEYEDPYLNE
jgi:hypothetical protein